ncbi:phasin family protein [Burkholderia guangdongensis]|uniref:phasin family protein n=1 Tax=Burkholderia guangdongensis TaxID=1792500 RepID=UPI001C54B336|nr:phasin family protein [Burkholderia guangdongensis]
MATRSSKTDSDNDARPAFDLSAFGDLGKLMQQFQVPGLDLSKLTEQFQKFQLPGVDLAAMLDWQRKDMEALIEANRQAYEGTKALVERHNEILQQTLAQWQASLKDSLGPDMQAKHAENARQGVQQAIANFQELASLEAAARTKAWQVVQDRLQENLANLQKLMQPK